MNYPSKLIEEAVDQISKLPGIGRKTALRLALHLLKQKEESTHLLAQTLTDMRVKTVYCKQCHNISDAPLCKICVDSRRNADIICVVADSRDVLAIENTNQYSGLYHVLGGLVSPMEGVGPSDLKIDSLIERIETRLPKEIILALSATMEGDTTAFYLQKRLKTYGLKISSIAKGVSVGSELEYTDELTLGRSIMLRIEAE